MPGLVERELEHKKIRLIELRADIPEEGHLDCTNFLFSENQGGLITLGELTNLWEELDVLHKVAQDFNKDMDDYNRTLEEILQAIRQ